MIEHILNPGALKICLKAVDAIAPGTCTDTISELDNFMEGPAWTMHRIDSAQDFWDDHKEDVSDFLDNVGDSISDVAESVGEVIGDFWGSLFN